MAIRLLCTNCHFLLTSWPPTTEVASYVGRAIQHHEFFVASAVESRRISFRECIGVLLSGTPQTDVQICDRKTTATVRPASPYPPDWCGQSGARPEGTGFNCCCCRWHHSIDWPTPIMTDRRSQPRYDVVGSLWGVLELSEDARVLNISTTGALVDSPFPCAVDSTQSVRLDIEGHEVTVHTRVRHVRPEPGSGTEPRYFLGLEFISLPLSVLQSIEQMNANPRLRTDAEGAS